MERPRLARQLLLAGGVLAGLAAPSAALAADPASRTIVLSENRLSSAPTDRPGEATAPVSVTGLADGDVLAGIDVRPQNGFLYGLGHNASANTIRLYALSARTGQATPLGEPIATTGTAFGFDFNPTVDRIRVVSDTGVNLRLDPNTGTVAGTDKAINGGSTTVDGAAYTNNRPNATATTLYTLSGADGKLQLQTPPNDGTQTAPRSVTMLGLPLTLSAIGGFDIAPGVDVGANNAEAPAGSAALASATLGGIPFLVRIDLATGAASPLGILGDGKPVQGIAIQQEAVPGGLPAIVATAGQLRRFDTAASTTATPVAITGLTAGEAPAGIDWRPQTGQLLLLGVDAEADKGTLYRVDPQSGVATAIGTPGSVAYVGADGTTPVDLPPVSAGYGVDVNPTVDRVRITTGIGLNARVHPDTGAAVDGNTTTPGTNTDGALNGAATDGAATAYSNAFGQPLEGGVTTQYVLSPKTSRLLIQNPPNAGTTTNAQPLSVGGQPLAFTGVGGFDLPPAVTSASANAAASGTGLAVLKTPDAPSALYAIDLPSGTATLRGTLDPEAPLNGLAVGDGPPSTTVAPISAPAPVLPGGPGTTTPAKAGFAKSTKVSLKLRATRISTRGPAKITFRNTNAFSVKARLTATTPKSGKRKAVKYATKSFTLGAKRSRTLNVRLPAAARKILSTKRKLTIRATLKVTAPNGKSRNVRKTLTARRK
ncbi:DUF4394 domain-containing protein [Patulibacter minatonensis]|uniref:DUF4394 domain-containing protein n=1 Tax=Patulibacter minatonensis TaxID=298163 RepID=UPI00047EC38A|nr:DUF4394 domain-containing protein [Patulibacter minatonensis]